MFSSPPSCWLRPCQVRLSLYDVLGREVRTMAGGPQDAGYHEVRLDGAGLASGVYVYRLEAGSRTASRSMLLLK